MVHNEFHATLLAVAARRGPGVALDLGAGEGADAIRLAKLSYQVDAVEVSPVACEKIERFARSQGVRITVRNEPLETVDLTGNSYDVVLMNGCLHYVRDKSRFVPRGTVQQPLRPGRRLVAGLPAYRPPVPRRQVAHQRVQVLPGLQPRLRPGKARPQQPHQGRPLTKRPPCPYPGITSRLVFICQHKQHDSGATALISRESQTNRVPAAHDSIGCCHTSTEL